MGKGAPTPPDPSTTAGTQGAWNAYTAQQQQSMNMTNQNTPYGSLSYNQTGSSDIVDPNGNHVSVPQYTATTSLSPTQQGIFDKTQDAQGNLADLASNQSAMLKDYLSKPFDYNPANDATKWAYDLGSQTVLPQQKLDTEALDRQLLSRGLRPGTSQYDAEMTRLQQGQSQQLNQLALGGESQAFNEAAYQRSNPINEITSLLSGSQITQPNSTFTNTPQTSVGGVDYTSGVNNNYNQEVAANNAQMGGLFGLGGTLGGGLLQGVGKAGGFGTFFSDRRLKSNIDRIGTTKHGLPFYEYDIFGRRERGVLAQEVKEVMPAAVLTHPSGFYMVDYSMLGLA